MNNFDVIRQDGRLLYEYIRGSHLYGLNNEDSDIDTSGVYVGYMKTGDFSHIFEKFAEGPRSLGNK